MIPILSHRSIICNPFCDYLNVTSPKDNGDLIMGALKPILDVIGAAEISPGVFQYAVKGGVFKYTERGQVCIFSASGGFLQTLRDKGLYGDYLAVLSSFPHRVSMLHATADFLVDPPSIIQECKVQGQSGRLQLTRKSIPPKFVHALLSLNADGIETGTVYLANRKNADVWAKVYDKQHERVSKGFVDPGSILRVEIAVQSDVGATLRDAFEPSTLFFHFASASLVEPPLDVAKWSANGEGFVLGESPSTFTCDQRLKAILAGSLDVTRLLRLAIEGFGDDAASVLTSLLVQRLKIMADTDKLCGGIA